MEKSANILSVNISTQKGTIKQPVPYVEIDSYGVKGDAHAGKWTRQVSLLGMESIRKFSEDVRREIGYGEFAENITTEGIILHETHPLDRFIIGDVILEVTQIGKKCHGENCAIFKEVGNCVMPKEGIFCRVISPGRVSPGDLLQYHPKTFKAMVITLSDRASEGVYEDRSGPRVREHLEGFFQAMVRKAEIGNIIIPDEEKPLKDLLLQAVHDEVDLVVTTGGTGIGPRDITPDVVKSLIDKEIPGIMDLIRWKYGQEKPNALISRSLAGVAGKTLIFVLPGSVNAVNEYMTEIRPGLKHMIYMLQGLDAH